VNAQLARRIPDTLIAVCFTALALPAGAQISTPLPGHERSLTIQEIDSSTTKPVIDGRLDDAAWSTVNASSGFWNSIRNRLPTDQTEVLALMDGEYLYFGFRLYDSEPDAITSVRTVRDGGLGYDDAITVELDTFFNRRDISEFSVNPNGTQSDAIAGGRSSKIEWKGDWTGAAERTDFGWTAEFAIPFAILNYNDDTTQFGVNFKRYQSRTKEFSYWADVTPQSLNEEMGQLANIELPVLEGKNPWTFMPFALAGHNIENKDGDIDSSLITAGIDMRYQPRPDLTGVFSVNPDFSQVEAAVTDISFSYTERSLSENRPFFAEGADYFSSSGDDEEYFYSNRVPNFDAGAKSFGRAGRAQFGLLTTLAPDNRTDFVGRTLYEVDETNSAIATIVGTNRSDMNNMLAVAQYRGRQPSSGLNYSLDLAGSQTTHVTDPELPDGNGSAYKGSIGWKGDYLYATFRTDRYGVDYFPANARLDDDLPGTDSKSVVAGYYREASNDLWREIQAYGGTEYREDTLGRKQRQKVYASGSVEFTTDIRVTLFHEQGPYRPVTDTRGVFEDELNDDSYTSMYVDFNTRSNEYAGGVQYDRGDLGGGPYKYVAAYGWWRPINPVYLKISAERIYSFGTYDQVVLTGSWDITPEHALGGRYIYTNDADYFRLAYSHRPREGLDIFAVYDNSPSVPDELSVKVVKTF